MKNIFTTAMVTIVDAESDCNCDCCGRKLKMGARMNDGHIVGVDCLAAMTFADRYLGKRGRGWAVVKGSDHRDTLKRMAHARANLRSTYPGPTLKVRTAAIVEGA
jgi:hypothetical protein